VPREEWEEVMAVSLAHVAQAQDSLEKLRRTWPDGAGISYEAACQGLATALVCLEECGLLYWQHERTQRTRNAASFVARVVVSPLQGEGRLLSGSDGATW
jgi:hypothetical protein